MKYGVMSLTTDRVHVGTQPAVSPHWRNAAECGIRMIVICMTSSTTEMHTAGLKTGARSANILSKSRAKKGTMTTIVPIMTNLTDSVLPKEGVMQEESRHSPKT
jgi:hypothetical protein